MPPPKRKQLTPNLDPSLDPRTAPELQRAWEDFNNTTWVLILLVRSWRANTIAVVGAGEGWVRVMRLGEAG